VRLSMPRFDQSFRSGFGLIEAAVMMMVLVASIGFYAYSTHENAISLAAKQAAQQVHAASHALQKYVEDHAESLAAMPRQVTVQELVQAQYLPEGFSDMTPHGQRLTAHIDYSIG